MRSEYEMTEAQLEKLLDAGKPTMCIKIGTWSPSTPQENANAAWGSLGREMGFRSLTAKPVPGKGDRFHKLRRFPDQTQANTGPLPGWLYNHG